MGEVAVPEPCTGQAASQVRSVGLGQRRVVACCVDHVLDRVDVAVEHRGFDLDQGGVMAAPTVTGCSGQPPGEQAIAPEEGQAVLR